MSCRHKTLHTHTLAFYTLSTHMQKSPLSHLEVDVGWLFIEPDANRLQLFLQ